jgi:fucose permease
VVSHWRDVPLAGLLLPAIGFFMAPIYPTLNSVVLSAVPRERQAALIGLIVVFSALGGTTGSRLVAELFSATPSASVLYALLAPIAVLMGAVVWLRRITI